jgi:hypothetical protein
LVLKIAGFGRKRGAKSSGCPSGVKNILRKLFRRCRDDAAKLFLKTNADTKVGGVFQNDSLLRFDFDSHLPRGAGDDAVGRFLAAGIEIL